MKHYILNKDIDTGTGFGTEQMGAGRVWTKKQLNFLLLLVLFILSVVFCSCEDVIDVKLNEEELNLIAVEATITTQDEPTVYLYNALKVNQDESFPGISGAIVLITDNAAPSNQITLVEDAGKKGLYQVPRNASFLGVAGREYTLTIQTQQVTLIAKDKLSAVEPLDSIVVEPSLKGDKRFLGIFIYGQEPKGIGNYYEWDIFINNQLVRETMRLSIMSDELIDGNYVMKGEIYVDIHDPDKADKCMLNLNDTIYVKQNSISKFVYNFYSQLTNQINTGSLFSVPPANIKSNFTSSDGRPVLGLFVARDVSISNEVVIDQSIVDQLRKP